MAGIRKLAPPEALQTLGEAVHRAHRAWSRLGEAVCEGLPLSPGQRRLMESLIRFGPRTVPELAKEDGVSRQHVQAQVNVLLDEGLLRTRANRAHRRSHILEVTAAGRRALKKARTREQSLLRTLGRRVTGAQDAVATLDRLSDALETLTEAQP